MIQNMKWSMKKQRQKKMMQFNTHAKGLTAIEGVRPFSKLRTHPFKQMMQMIR